MTLDTLVQELSTTLRTKSFFQTTGRSAKEEESVDEALVEDKIRTLAINLDSRTFN